MLFKDVIGQSSIKKRLIQEVQEGRVPHAQLFTGPEGVGKLPMAIAYARYLLCKDRREEDSDLNLRRFPALRSSRHRQASS